MPALQSSRQLLLLLGFLCLAFPMTNAAGSLEVTVTDGPKECDVATKIENGNLVKLQYVGMIDESSETGEKGYIFDSSEKRGKTYDFTVGNGSVIKGWDYGLRGLCQGAKATLIIPPIMGYGKIGSGGGKIPGGATLRFDVEVVEVIKEEDIEEPDLFGFVDENGDGKLSKEEMDEYFASQGSSMPDGLMEREDKNGDGFVSWEEFSGPKGKTPPGSIADEL